MQEKELQFQYKGKRDYVHGTDMYMEIIKMMESMDAGSTQGFFRVTIHEITRNQCRILCAETMEGIQKPENQRVEFSFSTDNKKFIGWLTETDSPVVSRYAYPEDDIAKETNIEGQTIKVKRVMPFLPIEVLVAINKHLHVSLFPEVTGKWYFTRLELNRLLTEDDKGKFELKFIQNLQFRLTKTQVFVNGKPLGHIYFSLVK